MFIRDRLIVFGLFFISPIFTALAEEKACLQLFESAREEVAEALKDKSAFIESYTGQDGYLRFMKSLNITKSMDYVFKLVFQTLTEKEKKTIGWQKFYGTAKEYHQTLERILDDKKKARSQYKSMEGYVLYANDFYKGDMLITYINISAVLDKRQMRELGWRFFQGSTKEYRKTLERILDDKGKARSQYKGMEGYALYADNFNQGDMRKTYKNISAVLSADSNKRQMRELGWKAFQGKTQEYRELLAQILDNEGKARFEYKGMEGYVFYADSFYKGAMQKTYVNISTILSQSQMRELGWRFFQGSTEDYRKTLERILNDKGVIRSEYKGMYGYALYADHFFDGDMRKTYINISAVLGAGSNKRQMWELGWQVFQGLTKSYRKARTQILDDKGAVRSEYKGMEGYLFYADVFSDGNMKKAYKNTSAILDKSQMRELGWRAFQGSTTDYRKTLERILDSDGKTRSEYKGMKGYLLYADRFDAGDMQKTYINISAVLNAGLNKEQMRELGWRAFQGNVQEFRKQRNQILNHEGIIKSQYKNQEGYVFYADSFYEGDMKKAYKNTSAVLMRGEMQILKWQYFQGSTTDYRKIWSQILNSAGELKSEYKGMKGYLLYADHFFEANMQKTYRNISAGLNKEQMRRLGWQMFRGTVQEFKRQRSQILNSAGKARFEYKGMEGYALYADRFYAGDMQKTYQQISAVLGGIYKMKGLGLSWKQFKGFASQYYALKDLFKRYEMEELKGSEGQGRVAEKVFSGSRHIAYHNVSILREELLGSRGAFTELGWSK